jgi:NADPH-dependent ferric siderophore reductase
VRRTTLAAVQAALTAPVVVTGTVVGAQPLSRRMQRVVIHAPEVDRLRLPGRPDAALGVYFGGRDDDIRLGRTYSVRDHDRSNDRITVDVVLHGDAAGTRWATNAAPGDRVELAHAKSWFNPPRHADRHVFVADLAGLPALARVIEGCAGIDTSAIVEVPDSDDLDYLPTRHGVRLITSIGTGNGDTESALARLVAQNRPAADSGYCWFAGEATEARKIRKLLRREYGWAAAQTDIVGYWRRDADAWSNRFAPHGPRMYSVYENAIADGKSEKLALEEFDDALERLGL